MKKNQNTLIAIIILLVISACSSSKPSYNTEQLEALDRLVESGSFLFEAEFANPLATRSMNAVSNAGLLPPGSAVNRINLMGTNNFLEIKGDSVSANLPYYGERQMPGAYNNSNVGIQFDGVAKDFKIYFNEKKGVYELQFKASNNTEVFDINAVLFVNNTVSLYVNSSERLTINYQGVLKKIAE
ncbi:DUF4251 domain-containing protein [Croceitalea rosinachiae]|uniref:DUF4251 domain-containing protein n=1 Tax=Croceitalea rosinachiae TaxID=3075596 RepID=A0ABU3ABN0_9FLAO|nr:DUF4251 domain-containing protein [Croceitalea sp. F388]MDT0607584.1 DUF4251 domain-containing protein [Croceitalea sp. F388]